MVIEMNMRKLLAAAAALFGASVLLASPAEAQTGICGMSGQGAVGSTATYDPFNPAGLAATQITLRLTRFNPPGGSRTEHMRFILRAQSADANGTIITPVMLTGANANNASLEPPLVNIFYNFGATSPTLTGTPSAGNRFAHIQFTGNNPGSDTVDVIFSVQFPANLNLSASANLSFDLEYTCTAQPGGATGGGTLPNQINFPIKVLSALQATYVGAALDFGEVGDKTTADVLLAPGTYSTSASGNNVRVLSSGPYKVEMTSANTYRLTFPGGNPGTAAQRLNYKALFLGQTVSNAAPTFAAVTCARAGVPASEADLLPIRATLLEGGDGKQLSPDYKDVITVTVSPLAVGPVGVNCPAVALPLP